VLLGRNGVGKSTLLRCLMGVVAAKSGSVSWRGTALGTLPPCARRGRARVRAAGPRDLSAADRRGEPAGRRGEPPSKVPDRIYELFPVLKDMRARRGGDLPAASSSSWRSAAR
jgi:urea transport system ATP-binding protein